MCIIYNYRREAVANWLYNQDAWNACLRQKKIGFLLRIVQNYIDQFVSVSKDLEQMVYNICSFIMPKNSN